MGSKTISELCTRVCSGGTPKSGNADYYEDGTIPWLNTREINFNRIRKTDGFITEAGLAASSAKWIRPNSVIVAMYGATTGKCAISKIPLTTNQACCNLEINDKVADYRYVYYWLMSHYSQIAGMANGGAQQNLNAKQIRELKIELPRLSYQHRVAEFLDTIDEKIELNQQANDYLTAMADARFDELVSDDPAEIQLPRAISILSGGTPKTKEPSYWDDGIIPFFGPGDAKGSAYTLETEKHITELGLNNCNSSLYPINTVFLTARGTVGKVAIAGRPMAMNQSCFAFSGIDWVPQTYVYQVIKRAVRSLKAKSNGATFAAINTRDLKDEWIPMPPRTAVEDYDNWAAPLFALMLANEEESVRLASLRDALLPKLMSGEIDVSRVELPTQPNNHLLVGCHATPSVFTHKVRTKNRQILSMHLSLLQ